MFEFLRKFRRGADAAPDEDPEIQEEMAEGQARLRQAEAAGVLPVLETQHRAIGTDVCHFAVPASLPDRADVFGKLFVTDRRVVFAGPVPVALGLGRVVRTTRDARDVVLVAGGELHRFRCNTFGDAMMAVWLLDRLRARATGTKGTAS